MNFSAKKPPHRLNRCTPLYSTYFETFKKASADTSFYYCNVWFKGRKSIYTESVNRGLSIQRLTLRSNGTFKVDLKGLDVTRGSS